MSEPIHEKAREIPVWGKSEVLVAGGGPAGLAAAISAARAGAKVYLVERYGFLGGMATAGLVIAWNNWAIENNEIEEQGIYKEIVDRIFELGGGMHSTETNLQYFINPETYKRVCDDIIVENNIELLLHSYVAAPVVGDNKLKGLIIENKNGRGALLGERIIDCTGDGDVFTACGCPFEKGRPKDGKMQPGSMGIRLANVDFEGLEKYLDENPDEQFPPPAFVDQTGYEDIADRKGASRRRAPLEPNKGRMYVGFPKIAKKAKEEEGMELYTNRIVFHHTPLPGTVWLNMSRVTVDATNAWDMTKAEIEGRKQAERLAYFYKKYMPGFEDSYLLDTSPQVGLRETRRLKGQYIVTKDDVLSGKVWEDTIYTIFNAGIDIHMPDARGFTLIPVRQNIHVPYRCLLPKDVENLVVAGRCISATHEALGAMRGQHRVMGLGQAAGVAAAISIQTGKSLKDIPIRKLQEELRRQNVNFGITEREYAKR
jgi:hypothetical protein